MIYVLVMAIHVIASLVLIAVILLQAGRGGGLSETFGGSSTQSILGTKTSVFLKRATATSAVIYILTCLTLAVLTSHKGRSLVSQGGMKTPITQGAGAPMPFADEPMDF
ncbi:MAG: preprotein translocase subunit SecG [Candidatus Omnitrophota bacterium]|jgi:preprotein translocase subunit SecG